MFLRWKASMEWFEFLYCVLILYSKREKQQQQINKQTVSLRANTLNSFFIFFLRFQHNTFTANFPPRPHVVIFLFYFFFYFCFMCLRLFFFYAARIEEKKKKIIKTSSIQLWSFCLPKASMDLINSRKKKKEKKIYKMGSLENIVQCLACEVYSYYVVSV